MKKIMENYFSNFKIRKTKSGPGVKVEKTGRAGKGIGGKSKTQKS